MTREDILEEVSQNYSEEGYTVKAVNEIYPGIIRDVPQEEHNAEGRVDILLEDTYIEGQLVNIEVGVTDSVSPDTIESMIGRKKEQAEKNQDYLEEIGLEAESETIIYPEGKLSVLYELFKQTSGSFTEGQAVDAAKEVSETGRLGNMMGEEIVSQGLTPTGTERYEINEEYEEIIDLFLEENFYP
ncbi:MAG: hypothetical protein ACI9LV_000695 [Candidatus Nanohaloarchaea archaeon]|jgi:hypothetical protein